MSFIKERLRAFGYAANGVLSAFKSEKPFTIHFLSAVAVIALGFYCGISKTEWCIIIICCGVVIAAELINTSIERLCDALAPQIDPKIKFVKDAGAGAVLIAAITSVIIAAVIFFDYFKKMV